MGDECELKERLESKGEKGNKKKERRRLMAEWTGEVEGEWETEYKY